MASSDDLFPSDPDPRTPAIAADSPNAAAATPRTSKFSVKMAWFKTNGWNLISIALGVLGLATGYLFYRASIQFPSLSFVDAPAHALVINYGAVSGSPVRLLRKDGSQVTQNVYSARIYIWNSGTTSLRGTAITMPLVIQAKNTEILDAKIAQAPHLDITRITPFLHGSDSINVTFDLLEPGDGMALNILYAASGTSAFVLDGHVEGVRSFSPIEMLPTGDAALRTAWRVLKTLGGFVVPIGTLFVGGIALGWLNDKIPNSSLKNTIGRIIVIVAAILFVGAVIFGVIVDARKEVVGTPRAYVPPELMK